MCEQTRICPTLKGRAQRIEGLLPESLWWMSINAQILDSSYLQSSDFLTIRLRA